MESYGHYIKNIEELLVLSETGIRLSAEIEGRKTSSDSDFYASLIFNKILGHVISVQRLLPESKYFNKETPNNIYDISSISSLVRALIDAYLTMYYISFDNIDEEERKFRISLWNYHSESRRLEKLRLIGSTSPELLKIEEVKKHHLSEIESNQFFEGIESWKKKDIRKCKIGIYLTNTEICERTGINPNYYKMIFMYLSSYVHTYPFSISQISQMSRDPEGVVPLLKVILDYTVGFFCRALNDYSNVFEDTKPIVSKCKVTIDHWLWVHKNFKGVNREKGTLPFFTASSVYQQP